MTKSVEEQLADTLSALNAVETKGQRYTIGDRELWRADLKALEKRAVRLERASRRKANGGVTIKRVIPL